MGDFTKAQFARLFRIPEEQVDTLPQGDDVIEFVAQDENGLPMHVQGNKRYSHLRRRTKLSIRIYDERNE